MASLYPGALGTAPPNSKPGASRARMEKRTGDYSLTTRPSGPSNSLTLPGETERFEAHDIERYRASSRSLMPEGLESNLSTSEMRDPIAILESRR